MRRISYLCVIILFWGLFLSYKTNADLLDEDKKALLDFVNNFPHLHFLNWSETTSICSGWTGITCNVDLNRVIEVRLPGVGFNGVIPAETIGRLSALQVLSLRSNGISGTFPCEEFSNLKNLSMLFLQSNKFSGPLPSDFSSWDNLSVVNLSNNQFSGSIPKSISRLAHLSVLDLANNSLNGEIPDLGLSSLQVLNLSNNYLSGVVPKSLQGFPRSAFAGNNVVFVNASVEQSDMSPVAGGAKPKPRNWWREAWFLGVVIGCGVLGVVAFGFLFFAYCLRRKEDDDGFTTKFPKGSMSPEKTMSGSQDSKNRLVFFEGCNYAFDLEDLLRASAEVLGKGTFGMSYKAILEDANVVVVKRLKEVSAGKREFEQQMELIGSIRHENAVALRAYYYSRDEKLMVNDHCPQGSVSAMLHNQKGEDRIPLDWETRLRIAIGAARGIAHIQSVNGGKFVHGNIRSSNIFLNSQKYGYVSDFGLATVMSPLAPPISRAAGYRAPEVTDTRKATQASDVYSFGVFLLEVLTGKSPVHATGGDELVHLVRWVHSVVREEWTAEVFDLEILRYSHVEEEMVEMLQIALTCVARVPEQRPRMPDLLKMIEDVRLSLAEVHPDPETTSASTPTTVG